MSWGVSGVGKPVALAAKLATEFSKNPCCDPEESVRQAAGAVIAACLAAQDPNSVVTVMAGGHQSTVYGTDGNATGQYQNTLNIKIDPIYGFVE